MQGRSKSIKGFKWDVSSIIHCAPSSAKQIGAAGSSDANHSPCCVRKTTPDTEDTRNNSQQTKGGLCVLWRTTSGIPQGVHPHHLL